MRSRMEQILLAVAVLVVMLCAAYTVLVSVMDGNLQSARTSFNQTKETLPATESTVPTTDAGNAGVPARDDMAILRSLMERARTVGKETGRPVWVLYKDPFERTSADWEDVQALLDLCGPLLGEIRSLAQTNPVFVLPKITPETFQEAGSIDGMYLLANLLAAAAEVAAGPEESGDSGDMGAAEENLRSIFLLVAGGRTSTFRQLWCWDIGVRAFAWVYAPADLTGDRQRNLVTLVRDTMPSRAAYAQALAVDVEMITTRISDDYLAREPLVDTPYLGDASTFLSRPIRASSSAYLLVTAQELMRITEQPYYEVRERFEAVTQQAQSGIRHLQPFSWEVPSWTEMLRTQCADEALVGLLQINIALAEYEGEQGSYPPTLDAIAVGFGGALPVDPFTGQGYRYQVSGDAFALYSLGPDQTDQRGAGDDIAWPTRNKKPAGEKVSNASS